MDGAARIAMLARRYWRLAAIPELASRREPLLDLFLDASWPLARIDRAQVRAVGELVSELPFALAHAAIASGVAPTDVLAAFADALDPKP
jgi:hypothetical protein